MNWVVVGGILRSLKFDESKSYVIYLLGKTVQESSITELRFRESVVERAVCLPRRRCAAPGVLPSNERVGDTQHDW